jgi:hypothetical protein
MPQATADHAPGRVDAGEQQHPKCAGDMLVIELSPVDARLGKKADQILARHLPAFGDFGGKERTHLGNRPLHRIPIGDAEFEKLVNPSAEQIAVL